MSTCEIDRLAQLLEDLTIPVTHSELLTTHSLVSPLGIWRASLAKLLVSLVDCDIQDAYKSIQWPNNIFNGDLSVTLPRLRPGCKPAELSTELVNKFPKDHTLFYSPIPEGVHLRVFLKSEAVPRLLLPYIVDRGRSYGFDPALDNTDSISATSNQQKLIVEFSSPNITSELQGRHLRSTIIGAFISRLFESAGWEVNRINYLGDWGKPIALLHVGWEKYGSEEVYQADPIGHLLEVYHKIEADFQPEQAASRQARDDAAKEGHDEGEAQAAIESQGIFAQRNEAFKKLENGDEGLMAFWTRVRDANVQNYESFYARLGVRFDEYSGESQISTETMVEVENLLKEKNISEESGGAWIVHMQNLGAKAGTAIIRDRSGSSTYLLRDLAAVLERSRKYNFDKMIYVVASDNSPHFTQLFKILEALDKKELAAKLQHIKFNDSSRMGSTLGKGYKPQRILDECETAIASLEQVDPEKATVLENESVSTATLSTSALLAQELSTRFASTHAFDTATLPHFKSGSGIDLQYWLTKVSQLSKDAPAPSKLADEDYMALAEEDQANLLRVLAQYPEVINATYNSLEPSGIVAYIASVTEQLAECLSSDAEEGEEEEPEATKITPGLAVLYEATRIVLENGMKLMGLPVLPSRAPQRADSPVEI